MRAESIINKSPEHKEAVLLNFLEKVTHFRNAANIQEECEEITGLVSDICEWLAH